MSAKRSKKFFTLEELWPNATSTQIEALKNWITSLILARLKRQKRRHELELERVTEAALSRFEALEALYARALTRVDHYSEAEDAVREQKRQADLAKAYLEWSQEHFEERRGAPQDQSSPTKQLN